MYTIVRTIVLGLSAVIALGTPAGAVTTLASASLFSVSALNEQCELTNVSSKPVTVLSAKVLDESANDITNFNSCVGTLQPGNVCVLNCKDSFTSFHPHVIVTLKESAKAVRGQCALFDGSSQTVSTPIQ
jgi:hypothetical protein